MTLRYHTRRGQQTPTYVCQRDGIAHGHPPCTLIPGHTLDQQIGEFLISQLTPLAAEAALTVSAELEHRAAEADALRAAHVERARYHADLARRRYLAVDPANRLVADTLEADWNTALRALNDAQAAYDKARQQHPGQLTEQQKARIRQLVTDLPGIWNDPATPARERKRIARLLLTDVTVTRTSDTITAHIRLPGGQHRTLTLPIPPTAAQLRKTPAAVVTAIDELLDHHTHAQIAGILNDRGLTSGEGRPFHRAHHPQHPRRVRAAQPRAATPRRRHAHPGRDGQPPRRARQNRQDLVPRRAHHRAPLQRQRPVPLPAARPQPADPGTRTQTQRTAPDATPLPQTTSEPPEMSDPTATVSTRTTTQHPASTRRGAVCNPRFHPRRLERGAQ